MRQIYNVHVYADCSQIWYLEDVIHRVHGPAQESADGSRFWYLHGVYHRLDGPAVMYADGTQYYYINGVEYSLSAYNKVVAAIVDYHSSMIEMNWIENNYPLDIISAMNDIALNNLDEVLQRNNNNRKLAKFLTSKSWMRVTRPDLSLEEVSKTEDLSGLVVQPQESHMNQPLTVKESA